MEQNSVILLGIDIEKFSDIKKAISSSYELLDEIHINKLQVTGYDGGYSGVGKILSENNKDFIKKIDLTIFNNLENEKKDLLKKLHQIDLFKSITIEDIQLNHTIISH